MKLALAGGTSPLANDLIAQLLANGHQVEVFSRSQASPGVHSYKQIDQIEFDVLVNLIGGHASALGDRDVEDILSISMDLVSVAVERQIPLVHLSSGSVLGPLDAPAINEISRVSGTFATTYQEVKVRTEELHDLHRDRIPISDLRLFSFAGTRFLKESNYFLSKLVAAAREKEVFKASGQGFLRDFSGPEELASSIELAVQNEFSGTANLFSEEPASRSQILSLLEEQYGLVVDISEAIPTQKIYCASRSFALSNFTPRKSLDVIESEFFKLLGPGSTPG